MNVYRTSAGCQHDDYTETMDGDMKCLDCGLEVSTCPDCGEAGRCAPTCHQVTDSEPFKEILCDGCGQPFTGTPHETEKVYCGKCVASPDAPLLGQDAAEAQRIAVAGRPIHLLKESREFDNSRLEANGLFPPAQRGMFGESK